MALAALENHAIELSDDVEEVLRMVRQLVLPPIPREWPQARLQGGAWPRRSCTWRSMFGLHSPCRKRCDASGPVRGWCRMSILLLASSTPIRRTRRSAQLQQDGTSTPAPNALPPIPAWGSHCWCWCWCVDTAAAVAIAFTHPAFLAPLPPLESPADRRQPRKRRRHRLWRAWPRVPPHRDAIRRGPSRRTHV